VSVHVCLHRNTVVKKLSGGGGGPKVIIVSVHVLYIWFSGFLVFGFLVYVGQDATGHGA